MLRRIRMGNKTVFIPAPITN